MVDPTSTLKLKHNILKKYSSLAALSIINATLALSMRYAATRTPKENRFLSSTAVIWTEVIKLIICLTIVLCEQKVNVIKFCENIYKAFFDDKIDTLKVCVPSFLYVIQNNLLYVSAANLDAATNQVSYQLKILTTAIFAVIILRKKLLCTQWCSLVLLMVGVAMLQLTQIDTGTFTASVIPKQSNSSQNISEISHGVQNRWLGFGTVLIICTISGFSGVYFEKILKSSDLSVWLRNIQMYSFSVPLSIISCLIQDYSRIAEKGFFHGCDWYVIYLVSLNAFGGLSVAVVVKYADNILKGFATSIAIIITCVASIFIFHFEMTRMFVASVALVISAVFLYGYVPNTKVTKIEPKPLNSDVFVIDTTEMNKQTTRNE